MQNSILIHGAWGGAWVFDGILDRLHRAGHRAEAIDLPGHGRTQVPIPEVTMETYVSRVVEAVRASAEPVVLVGHSLAGAVISQVAEEVGEKIDRLVYVAAALPRDGETTLGLMQSDPEGRLLERVVFSEDQSVARVRAEDITEFLLHDVEDRAELGAAVEALQIQQAVEPFLAPARLTEERFGAVAKFYVRAGLDRVMTPALQDRMASAWELERVFPLESGHFPLISQPQRLADVLVEIAELELART